MSRIGRAPIDIPAGVTVTLGDGNKVTVKGPKGELFRICHPDMIIKMEDNVITVARPSEDKLHKSLHGLTRTLIHNMVLGVTEGFTKSLEINGVGYRAVKQGNNLNLSLGFSHPVIVEPPTGITLDAPAANKIVISGIDKEAVGAMAATIRDYREPEPYKGKGIKYEGEHIRRKVGKAGAKGKK
jgi:large subunit ribosomal protein L6